MPRKSPGEYRDYARAIRALAAQARDEDARSTLLGLAAFCDYFGTSLTQAAQRKAPAGADTQSALEQPRECDTGKPAAVIPPIQ